MSEQTTNTESAVLPTTGEASAPQTPTPAVTRPAQAQIAASLQSLMEREREVRDYESRMNEYERLKSEHGELKKLAQTDPIRFLEQQGVAMDQLEQLKTESHDPTVQLRRELSELRSRVEQSQQEKQAETKDRAFLEARTQVKNYVEDSDDFPFTKAAEASDTVFDHMMEHYNSTGEMLGEEQAAREVEGRLRELITRLSPLLQNNTQVTQEAQSRPQVPTLTNEHASVGSSQSIEDLSDTEALRLLASRIKVVQP